MRRRKGASSKERWVAGWTASSPVIESRDLPPDSPSLSSSPSVPFTYAEGERSRCSLTHAEKLQGGPPRREPG